MKHWSNPINTLRHWWRSLDNTTRKILTALVATAVIISVPFGLITGDMAGLMINLGTELAGGVVTFVLLEQVLGTSRQKADLIAQLGSQVNDEARRAAEEMQRREWVQDGCLRGKDLSGAVLSRANLRNADLARAKLNFAELHNTCLIDANLQNAHLKHADLKGANMTSASLASADLLRADLSGASAGYADFQEAKLHGVTLEKTTFVSANLSGVDFLGAKFNGNIDLRWADLTGAMFPANFHPEGLLLLPDETEWTPETDMERFTDPDHPDYWREEYDDRSPAYKWRQPQASDQRSWLL